MEFGERRYDASFSAAFMAKLESFSGEGIGEASVRLFDGQSLG